MKRFDNIHIDNANVRADISFDWLSDNVQRAQMWLDHQIFEDTVPFIPMDTGNMTELARDANFCREGTGEVIMGNTVYAWYQWTGVSRWTGNPLNYQKTHHPQATDHWFEASKLVNEQKWREGVRNIIYGG